mgnify:CR=1 FL=1
MKNIPITHLIISAGYILSLLLLGVDSYKSTDSVLRYLGASSTFFLPVRIFSLFSSSTSTNKNNGMLHRCLPD